MQDEIVGTPNQCIYCGQKSPPLTKEHIVPYALNGTWVLKNAVCPVCQAIISRSETLVLRKHLLHVRSALSLKTRKPKNRPTKFPIQLAKQNEEDDPVLLPTLDQPVLLLLPIFDQPGFLIDRNRPERKGGVTLKEVLTYYVAGKSIEKFTAELKAEGYIGFDVVVDTSLADFALMIAKIAHGYTIREIGLENIAQSYVKPIILGKSKDIGKWVGTIKPSRTLEDKNAFHRVTLDIRQDGTIYCEVHLFASFNTPVYLVVVGRASQDFLDKHKSVHIPAP